MAQFLVRNVPENIAVALKKRAKKNGRSTEAELRAILKDTIKPKGSDFWQQAAKLREETRGRISGNSADIIREEREVRDRRW